MRNGPYGDSRRLSRRRYRRSREFPWFSLVVVAIILFAVLNLFRVASQWHDCNQAGGKMVQGLSTTGYVCVEGK